MTEQHMNMLLNYNKIFNKVKYFYVFMISSNKTL